MKQQRIIPKRIGFSNAILVVSGKNSILVDTGIRRGLQPFRILFRQAGLSPGDLKLIVLTHTHYDHTGNLHALKKWTGAPVVVHEKEFENLRNGFIPIPQGMGRYTGLASRLGKTFFPRFASPAAFRADLKAGDQFDLKPYGIDGTIIYTPGHTPGSQSVLIGKTLISGDTFIHMNNGIIFPHFVEDPHTLLQTWKRLFEMGIEEIYPGHGPRFRLLMAQKAYERWKQKIHKKKAVPSF